MRKDIVQIGIAVYGSRWQTDLARDLGLKDGRRIRQWLVGERPVPIDIALDLKKLLVTKMVKIEGAINDISLARLGSKELLIIAGSALFGCRWQTEIARKLGLKDGRRIRQWLDEERPMPNSLTADLAKLLNSRKEKVKKCLCDISLEAESEAGVFANL